MDTGSFVVAFAAGLGHYSITEAELWAILKGLQLARARDSQKVHLETDSLAAVRLIKMECSPLHPCFNLIQDIRCLMQPEDNFYLSHILREANQVADGLAKMGLSLEPISRIFENLPLFLSAAFCADNAGVIFPRVF